MPFAIVESLDEIDADRQAHGAELALERSDVALIDSDELAAHVDEVMDALAVRDGRISRYLLRAERVRKELRIYHLTSKRLCRVTINQSTITNRHSGELDDRAYEHIIKVLDLEGVGGGFEVRVPDARVVGEEERGAVRRQSDGANEQFPTLAYTATNDRHDAYAECSGIEDLLMQESDRRGVLVAGGI